MFLPVGLVLVANNVGHVRNVAHLVGDETTNERTGAALLADGLATTLAGPGGASATTTHGENIGVITATRVFSTAADPVAGMVAAPLSLSPKLGAALNTVPAGVLGGATVALHGLIGLIGVKIGIDNRVDFSKPANQNPAAVALIFDIGDLTLNAGDITFTDIAPRTLAAVVLHHGMRAIERAPADQPGSAPRAQAVGRRSDPLHVVGGDPPALHVDAHVAGQHRGAGRRRGEPAAAGPQLGHTPPRREGLAARVLEDPPDGLQDVLGAARCPPGTRPARRDAEHRSRAASPRRPGLGAPGDLHSAYACSASSPCTRIHVRAGRDRRQLPLRAPHRPLGAGGQPLQRAPLDHQPPPPTSEGHTSECRAATPRRWPTVRGPTTCTTQRRAGTQASRITSPSSCPIGSAARRGVVRPRECRSCTTTPESPSTTRSTPPRSTGAGTSRGDARRIDPGVPERHHGAEPHRVLGEQVAPARLPVLGEG